MKFRVNTFNRYIRYFVYYQTLGLQYKWKKGLPCPKLLDIEGSLFNHGGCKVHQPRFKQHEIWKTIALSYTLRNLAPTIPSHHVMLNLSFIIYLLRIITCKYMMAKEPNILTRWSEYANRWYLQPSHCLPALNVDKYATPKCTKQDDAGFREDKSNGLPDLTGTCTKWFKPALHSGNRTEPKWLTVVKSKTHHSVLQLISHIHNVPAKRTQWWLGGAIHKSDVALTSENKIK